MIWGPQLTLTKPTPQSSFLFFEHAKLTPALISQHHLLPMRKSHLYDHCRADSAFSPCLNVSFIVECLSEHLKKPYCHSIPHHPIILFYIELIFGCFTCSLSIIAHQNVNYRRAEILFVLFVTVSLHLEQSRHLINIWQ